MATRKGRDTLEAFMLRRTIVIRIHDKHKTSIFSRLFLSILLLSSLLDKPHGRTRLPPPYPQRVYSAVSLLVDLRLILLRNNSRSRAFRVKIKRAHEAYANGNAESKRVFSNILLSKNSRKFPRTAAVAKNRKNVSVFLFFPQRLRAGQSILFFSGCK